MAEHLAAETLGLLAGIEEDAVLGGALGAEVVGGAADGDHQGVVGERARRHQFEPLLVQDGGQLDVPALTRQPAHAAQLEFEVVPLGLRDVVELVGRGIQRAGGDLVQQGLPDVRQVGVDQGDAGLAALAKGLTQAGSKLQAAGAAADDYNAMGH